MAGTIRHSEVYGRTFRTSSPKPPAVNEASGPPGDDTKPAIVFLGLLGLLILARVLWEQSE